MFDKKCFLPSVIIPKDNGKADKICKHPTTGEYCGANDPTLWVTYEEAKAIGPHVSFCVHAPYFVVDIDKECPPDNAKEIMKEFKGCYIEYSQSGKGFHIIGKYTDLPPHKNKYKPLDLELYTTDRHILLTGKCFKGGDPESLADTQLHALIEKYFKVEEKPAPVVNVETGEYPYKTLTDQEIIKYLSNEKMRKLYPLFSDTCDYEELFGTSDRSKADQGLACKIAFYTHKFEQIKRIMFKTSMVRDKWDRDDYMKSTIEGAIEKIQIAPFLVKPKPVTIDDDGIKSGFPLLDIHAQKIFFKDHVYVSSLDIILDHEDSYLGKSAYNNTYAGKHLTIDEKGKTVKEAWDAFIKNELYDFPKVKDISLNPFREHREIFIDEQDGLKKINMFKPYKCISRQGDASLFINHIKKILPDERDQKILLSWMATVVQQPWKKILWAPVLQGCEGNGKSLVCKVLEYVVGEDHSYPADARDIDSNFNAWLENKRFVVVDEIDTRGNPKQLENLKKILTEHSIQLTKKGKDQYKGKNYACFMMTTNYIDAIRMQDGMRRYCILVTAQQKKKDKIRDGMDTEYFNKYHTWFDNGGNAIIADYLANYNIEEEFNPLTRLKDAPESSKQKEVLEENKSQIITDLENLIDSHVPGMKSGWVSSAKLQKALPKYNNRKMLKILKDELGYINCPGLGDKSRPSTAIPFDGERSILLIHKDKVLDPTKNPVEIYEQEQHE